MAAPLTGKAALAGQTVLVLGASGQVGRFAVPMLVAGGAAVIAVSRHGRPRGYPELGMVDWVTPDAVLPLAQQVSMLLSAGPLGLAHDWLVRCPQVRAVAATSSTSVVTKLQSTDPRERTVVAGLADAETRLADATDGRPASLCLLRPTLVYGAGLDHNLARLAAFIRRFGMLPVATNAGGRRQPLHAEDLAAALVSGLAGSVKLWAPLAGGETVTYREMAGRVFDALGRRRVLLPVPPGLLALATRLAGAGANPAMVRRQSVDLVFDDAAARQALGVSPRAFRPRAVDFSPPSPARLRALAGVPHDGGSAQGC